MTADFVKIKEFWINDLKIDIFRNPNGEYYTSSKYKDSDEEAKVNTIKILMPSIMCFRMMFQKKS